LSETLGELCSPFFLSEGFADTSSASTTYLIQRYATRYHVANNAF
jgi:hypothetical protein